jgi:hypothetical protein
MEKHLDVRLLVEVRELWRVAPIHRIISMAYHLNRVAVLSVQRSLLAVVDEVQK